MGILLWIVFGALAGWVASMLMSSKGGLVFDIVLGIVGAIVGGFIMSLLGQGGVNGFTFYSLAVAVLGACAFIYVARLVRA